LANTVDIIRVLLAEDQAMVRGALAALLSLERDIQIVAEVSRSDEVVPTALATQPDVVLIDIEMPGGDGLTAAAELHRHAGVPGNHSHDLRTSRVSPSGIGRRCSRLLG
jgi:two-component system response regulator DesR